MSLGRAGTPARARLAPLSETELARLLREDPDLWLPVVRTQRPEAWARALAHALDGPERVDDPMVAHVLRIDLLLGLDGADQTERRLLVMGASTLWRRGDGVKALTVLERIPPELDDPQVWSLRARLHATAGEDARAREAIARWRATARPAFDVDAMLEADPALSRLIEAP